MDALKYVDIGVIGEGEITVPELCDRLINGKSYDDVAGLIWKDKKYFRTPPRPPIEDLDSLPYPDFDGFELEKTFDSTASISGLNSKRTIYMLASRSCPFQCSFCFHTVGRKYRQRSLDSFFAELEFYLNKYRVEYVCIEDELFSYNSDRIREFCERIKKYHIRWWTSFRVDMVEPWLTQLLKESGCDVMAFGLESADNRVLKSMGKHTTVEQIESTLAKVVSEGMHIEGAFIFGDTAETYETANNTLAFWLNHPQYRIGLNVITIFPGSPLYWKAVKLGVIKDRVKYLREGCPQINITQMSKEEFLDVVLKCMNYPYMRVHSLTNYEVLSVEPTKARVDLKSTCDVCGTENIWSSIKLFTSNALGCKKCGQRYNLSLPESLHKTFDKNLKKLADIGEVAVWGVNYITTKLFKEIDTLANDERVFSVDSSTIKQGMKLGVHAVQSPTIIQQRNIQIVVVAIPAYYHQISLEIHYLFPEVKLVVDVCDLIDDKFHLNSNVR